MYNRDPISYWRGVIPQNNVILRLDKIYNYLDGAYKIKKLSCVVAKNHDRQYCREINPSATYSLQVPHYGR